MKKSVNKFALLLWALALLLLGAEAMILSVQMPTAWNSHGQQGETGTIFWIATDMVRGHFAPTIVLAAFGYMIELLDQIRRNTGQKAG